MNVFVNAKPVATENTENLQALLEKTGISGTRGIAIALNNIVIPKNDWEHVSLKENDKIIVIKATQGG